MNLSKKIINISDYDYIIGIDPDINKTGVCVYDVEENILAFLMQNFFQLTEMIKQHLFIHKILVVIEKGEENKAIFGAQMTAKKYGILPALKHAQNVGQNFAITNLIEQFCKEYKIDYQFYCPKKTDAKLTVNYMKSIEVDGATNQELRDAFRCIQKYYFIKN